MSPREKKLLIFLLAGGLVMLNLFGLSFYQKKREELGSERLKAERALELAKILNESREQVIKDMEWLAEHEPERAELQALKSVLLDFCIDEAKKSQLEVKKFDFATIDNSNQQHYHRVGVKLNLTGMEKDLYECLHRINIPAKFRAVTRITLSPNTENDELIDCFVVIEQWFVPTSTI